MTASLTCVQCGGDLGAGDRFCAQCGAELRSCGGCGASLLPTDLSCPECGTPAESTVIPHPLLYDQTDPELAWADMVERLRRATLGEFEIGRELGRGGMAAVFLAHEIALDRKVAIKVLSPGLMLGDGMIDRFRHEAITIAHLNHPNIVSLYSVRQAEGLYFFVMRHVQGRSLEQVIQQAGKLPLPIVRSILYQVGSALAHAHRSRVIHRDIKPANILIDEEGNAVVTDFGIAKVAETPSQTLTGALVGTPVYMSPEQCSGSEVSSAADQYALGVVAYEMVTGAPPFSGSTLTVMQAHVDRAPASLKERGTDCPPEFEAALLRMMAKDQSDRWARVADAMAALGAAPLGEDDPLRAELSRLVSSESAAAFQSEDRTPTSPAPRTRSSSQGLTPGRAVGGIAILPPPAGLEVGDSFVLVAMVRGQHGTRLPPSAVTWSSDVEGVLRFDSGGGVAVAVATGSVMLTASCRGVRALLRVEVAPPRADAILIDPVDQAVHAGDEIRLEAVARDKRGQPVSRPVVWHSDDSSRAVVAPDGSLEARTPGFARITAALDDALSTVVIPILPARVAAVHLGDWPASVMVGWTFIVEATPVDRWENPLAERAVLWSTSDERVAEVDPSGKVTALRPGSVGLTATCEGVTAAVKVQIVAPATAKTDIETRRRPRRRRDVGRVAAAALGALLGVAVWVVGTPRLNRPDPEGETVAANTPPSVDSSAPASVVITRRPGRSLRPSGATRLAAEVRDLAGRAVPAQITWSSTDSSIVRVQQTTGWARGVRPGRAILVAASGEWRDSTEIVIRRPTAATPPPTVASVSISPHDPLRVGDTATLEVIALDAAGARLDRGDVAWRSSNLEVAAINPETGRVRARSPGTALILAQVGSEMALAELRVLPLEEEPSEPEPANVAAYAPEAPDAPVTVPRQPAQTDTLPRTDVQIRAGVERCYGAVKSGNVAALSAMYRSASSSDADKLERLSRILRTPEWSAEVGPRADGNRRLGFESSFMEFSFDLSWRDAFGGRLSSQPVFRAEFERNGDRWEMTSCRIIGSPRL